MQHDIHILVDEELYAKAKRLGLNISEFCNGSLSTFLKGVPDEIIKRVAALDKTQRGKVNRKLIRISKEIFKDSGVK